MKEHRILTVTNIINSLLFDLSIINSFKLEKYSAFYIPL